MRVKVTGERRFCRAMECVCMLEWKGPITGTAEVPEKADASRRNETASSTLPRVMC